MRKTVLKVFSSIEKEQKFINSMNQKGWKLEMIRFGSFYKFVSCEPCEYFTEICAVDARSTGDMIAAAVLCGYECIPHSGDGLENFLYLTARTEKMSGGFISDNAGWQTHYKNVAKRYSMYACICTLLGAVLAVPGIITVQPIVKILTNLEAFCEEHAQEILSKINGIIFFVAIGLFILACGINMWLQYTKAMKKSKQLHSDMQLYE